MSSAIDIPHLLSQAKRQGCNDHQIAVYSANLHLFVAAQEQQEKEQQKRIAMMASLQNGPPFDKPWLISSAKELHDDAAKSSAITDNWMLRSPFPSSSGSSSSSSSSSSTTAVATRAQLVQWLDGIEKAFRVDLNAHIAHNCAMDAPGHHEFARAELLRRAPAIMQLELYCDLENLDQCSPLVDADAVAKGLSLYGRKEYTGELTLPAYRTWLAVQAKGNSLPVLFATVTCSKTSKIHSSILDMTHGVGLPVASLDVFQNAGLSWWGLNPIVGENLYCACEQGSGAAVQLLATFKKPGQVNKATFAMGNELLRIKAATSDTEDPKTFLIVKPAGLVGEPDIHVLWLSLAFEAEIERMRDHFRGEGESFRIRRHLKVGDPSVTIAIFAAELVKLKSKYRLWAKKMCAALALTMTIAADTSWMESQCRKEAARLVRELAKYLRTNLLKKTDSVLGIGSPNEAAVVHGTSASRKALYILLENAARTIQAVLKGAGVKRAFNYLATPRKSKKDTGSVEGKVVVEVSPSVAEPNIDDSDAGKLSASVVEHNMSSVENKAPAAFVAKPSPVADVSPIVAESTRKRKAPPTIDTGSVEPNVVAKVSPNVAESESDDSVAGKLLTSVTEPKMSKF